MEPGIEREKAYELLKSHVKAPNLIKHSLASEAVMRALAEKLNKNIDAWGISGLLHDLDIEITNADLKIHGNETEKILKDKGINSVIIEAIRMHNEISYQKKRHSAFHHALAASETITGLITATALVYPDKKLKSVKTKSIIKRMKEKSFAASVNRDIIKECEFFDISFKDFAELALRAMQNISDELGL